MGKSYRQNEVILYQGQRYSFVSKNPDGSLLVRPYASRALVNIPDSNIIQESVAKNGIIYSGRLNG